MKNNNIEKWEGIKDWEDMYEISNFGRLKGLSREVGHSSGGTRILKEKISKLKLQKKNLMEGGLWANGKKTSAQIARLVYTHFIGELNSSQFIRYKDNNPENCHIDNLYIETRSNFVDNLYKTNKLINGMKGKGGEGHYFNKIVNQYDLLNGKLIKSHYSITNAVYNLKLQGINICNQSIGNVCKGKYKTAGGFIWKYKEN